MREGASGFNLSTAEYEVRGAVGVLMAASEVSYVANFMPACRILPYLGGLSILRYVTISEENCSRFA